MLITKGNNGLNDLSCFVKIWNKTWFQSNIQSNIWLQQHLFSLNVSHWRSVFPLFCAEMARQVKMMRKLEMQALVRAAKEARQQTGKLWCKDGLICLVTTLICMSHNDSRDLVCIYIFIFSTLQLKLQSLFWHNLYFCHAAAFKHYAYTFL